MPFSVAQIFKCTFFCSAYLSCFVAGDVIVNPGSDDAFQVAKEAIVSMSTPDLQSESAVKAPALSLQPRPYTIPLDRESRPVKRKGKVVSFKTTYSGMIQVGSPPEKFRVVFDTGSGHVVLPSVKCADPACQIHKQYNQSLSSTGFPINIDKTRANEGEATDKVTIGFGVGKIKGGFYHERVCIGSGDERRAGSTVGNSEVQPCADVPFIAAEHMSQNPFGLFPFDGICGLGLSALALDPEFSFFNVLTKGSHLKLPQFGFFLTEGEDGDDNELAVGGHNPDRVASPLRWASVPMVDKGYWQVNIVAVHIGDHTLDFCKDGSCRGIVDTGSSHLGVPVPHDVEMEKMLSQLADDLYDCRLASTPEIKIELPGFNLTLGPEHYMRRLPLRNDVSVTGGITHPDLTNSSMAPNATNSSTNSAAAAVSASIPRKDGGVNDQPPPKKEGNLRQSPEQNEADSSQTATDSGEVPRWCRPRMMPIKLPAPIGPNIFILGEPVLHKYYTVFDWATKSIGFGLAKNNRLAHGLDGLKGPSGKGALPKDIDVFLMQQEMEATSANGNDQITMFQQGAITVHSEVDEPIAVHSEVDELHFVQVELVRVLPDLFGFDDPDAWEQPEEEDENEDLQSATAQGQGSDL